MKERVKIDLSALLIVILATTFVYFCRNFYPTSRGIDRIFDFLGIIAILKGTLLRMAARGHKKAHSQKGSSLVMTGPYTIVRNPMYLGSLMIGSGFVLIIWPWWFVFIFGAFFYLRFKAQIASEEGWLSEHFKDVYTAYCQKVPRLFPSIKQAIQIKMKDAFDPIETFSTKEKYGLMAWPLLGLMFGLIQERIIYQSMDVGASILTLVLAGVVFFIGIVILYKFI